MELKPKLQDYTESEFQALVDKIWNVEASKEDHDRLINHFDRIVDHPSGADLLFYPEDTSNLHSPGAVTFLLKYWYHLKRLIPFKDGVLPAPFAPVNVSSFIGYTTARAKHELANAQRMAADIASEEQTVDSAFSLLESAIEHLPKLQHSNATLEALEKGVRRIEHAQHEVLMAVRAFEGRKMRVEFDKDAAQRNLSYTQDDRTLWQANLQQATANQVRYLARLSSNTQRLAELHTKAETVVDHAWQQLVRLRTPDRYPNVFRLSVVANLGRPDLLISDAQPLMPVQRVDLQKTLRSAVAEFNWSLIDGAQKHPEQYASVLSFGFASRAKAVRFGFCAGLTELSLIDPDWQALAAQRGSVELPLRMSTTTVAVKPGSLSYGLKAIRELFEVYITPCAGFLPGKVRVRPAVWHEDERAYRFTTDGPQPDMIEWTYPRGLEAPAVSKQDRLDSTGFVRSSPVPELALFDSVEAVRFDDYVVVFPPDSGLEPVYVLFNDRRDCPGGVSGEGHAEAEDWQTQALSSQGASVPASVADPLRGQVFERFDLFKRAFWKAVAAVPALNAQFNIDNRALLLSGLAPRSELPEDNRTLRILHRVDVTQGGGVYDLDNLIIQY
ncbi:bacteriocin immunity protein [Pseudomonas sp. SAICEU22]|uniref:Bacteriocin immunity protein n=1 Tax=Pseudomonas agronomica TaxID=2979328 RepID=A0ABT3F542_9PSED|nr:bacteriocin immunity protein [Pseudomonas agronomica]MCW1244223.1 bacteriocin immunity protein [Pseudomonas agronomica]